MATHKKRRGFSLIEAAIVLAMVGLVIGGIWLTTASVRRAYNRNKDVELVLSGLQKVKNLYYKNASNGEHAQYFTPSLAADMGIIPKSLLVGSSLYGYSGHQMLIPKYIFLDLNHIGISISTHEKKDCAYFMFRFSSLSSAQTWGSYGNKIGIHRINYYDESGNMHSYPDLPLSLKKITDDITEFGSCSEVVFIFKF